MNYEAFCAAVQAEFSGVHYLLFDETPGLPYRAIVGHTSIARRYEIPEGRVGAWAVELGSGAVVPASTLKEAGSVLRRRAADILFDFRGFGVLPLNYALALDAFDAVVKEDVAAMTPEQRAEADGRIKAEIRRRLAERRALSAGGGI